jgi:hypothetical protein
MVSLHSMVQNVKISYPHFTIIINIEDDDFFCEQKTCFTPTYQTLLDK